MGWSGSEMEPVRFFVTGNGTGRISQTEPVPGRPFTVTGFISDVGVGERMLLLYPNSHTLKILLLILVTDQLSISFGGLPIIFYYKYL